MIRSLKIAVWLIFSLLLGATLNSCGGSGGSSGESSTSGTASSVIIPATTKIITNDAINSLTSISSDGSTLTFNSSAIAVPNLNSGDTIVSDVAPNAPNGFLLKVVAVAKASNGNYVVTTTPTTLEQSIQQGALTASGTLTSDNLVATKALRQGVSFKKDASGSPVIQFNNVDLNVGAGNNAVFSGSNAGGNVVVSGNVTISPNYNFSCNISSFQLQHIAFTATEVETGQISASSTITGQFTGTDTQVGQLIFSPVTFFIGAVPVVVQPILTVSVGGNGNVSIGMTSSVTQQATLTAGVNYANGNWTPTDQISNTYSYNPPTISANASATVYGKPEIQLAVYGVVTPYLNLKGSLSLNADITTNPWWTLSGGLESDLGMKMSILGVSLGDYSTTLFNNSQVIAQANGAYTGANVMNVTGNWSGNIVQPNIGTNFLETMVLTQNGTQVTGTARATSGSNYVDYIVSGTVNNSTSTLNIAETSIVDNTAFTSYLDTFILTYSNNGSSGFPTLNGTWTDTGGDSGTLSMTKQ